MTDADFRFYGSLNDFLPPNRRQKTVRCGFKPPQSVKHLIEALGVPHPEVALFVTSGVAVDFNYLVAPDDRIAVYPEGHNQDIGALHPLRPPSPARFILDNHLGSLARYMRLVGLDTRYPVEHLADAQLAEIATDIVDQLEPKTRKYYNEFHRCRRCDQIYWKGSHFEKLERVMDALLQNS